MRRWGRAMYNYIRVASPVGLLTLTEEDGALTALVLDGQKYMDQHLKGTGKECETEPLRLARLWLEGYFAGKAQEPSALPLAPKGTAFQKRVWQALRDIPYGQTTSYGKLAEALGSSPRAVGGAVGRNPLSILIPCHRVLASDGSLTGYAGGLENKKKLLQLEGAPSR